MASNKWDIVNIETEEGTIQGVAPIIISASRSTDISAFYSEWFMNRVRKGYVKWINPFNGKPQYISFEKTRVFVFWTKDAKPLISYLHTLDEKGFNYYFTFTINDYEKEGLEPRVPKLQERIDTFKRLSEKIGKEKVIWRFDPLLLTDQINVDTLLDKIFTIGSQIADYTNKLIFSFADITTYRKVQINLQKQNINYKEFTTDTMETVANGLFEINRSWDLEIAICSEDIDLAKYNINKNKCIDDALMVKAFHKDKKLMDFLGYECSDGHSQCQEMTLFDFVHHNDKPMLEMNKENHQSPIKKLKDKGQRQSCGCIVSKDIGQYDTCSHECIYCYANKSPQIARSNYQKYLKSNKGNESILY